jgi:adenylosuccinate synthase
MINGITNLIITKTDVLNDFNEIKICIGYTYFDKEYGEELSFYKYDNKIYNENSKPIYKKFNSWNTIENKNPSAEQDHLEDYIQYIESEIGIPVSFVSIGEKRDDIYERY